ncbi:pollen-specific leucine-rich repeat extensin-like protein 3 [Iris pallida]|uniref:Pollen-specific leucine-rich repeat extensin-like protein 3 n=1 Tax=Iris pallida TaxID=29817 RepID=A0AAX6GUJ5_IRIPA|nr:pollen-specific leucine-rich repeat extensin-like protein 3 [Iris pallida]
MLRALASRSPLESTIATHSCQAGELIAAHRFCLEPPPSGGHRRSRTQSRCSPSSPRGRTPNEHPGEDLYHDRSSSATGRRPNPSYGSPLPAQ